MTQLQIIFTCIAVMTMFIAAFAFLRADRASKARLKSMASSRAAGASAWGDAKEGSRHIR